ncbi:chemotaxis protein [Chelativorans sp. YIM 93263]|uniref:chemotaxis protein n=1 Tax=Chelativorans sp. YIM 93263 TaxID=2906648 RepID=UPI0023791C09|nr:chemotaxis protein [Chelativorans sp. YIM 93263]
MRWRRFGVAALSTAMMLALSPAHTADLEPYQMMRSLQVVQDRIANGDHASMPMQRELLEIIDERLRAAGPESFQETKNVNALLIYGASGGNPATVETVFSNLDLEGEQQSLAQGILHYVRGNTGAARARLSQIDPFALDREIAAPIALVTGSLLSGDLPEKALRLLDQARLLSPGTLVEEAALRRTIALSARIRDPERFALATIQYVSRFLNSPYASQFAQDFVSAVALMHDEIEFHLIEEVADMMSDDRAFAIYLRIARQSAIDGYDDLLAFASEKATTYASRIPEAGDDPRTVLYANIASIKSNNIEDVRQALGEIDPGRLSTEDKKLLEAARRVAESIIAPPSAQVVLADEIAERKQPPNRAAGSGPEDDTTYFSEAYMAETQSRLDAVDALLKEDGR